MHGFVVRLHLTDGSTKEADLGKFLIGPVFDAQRSDRNEFLKIGVDTKSGTIAWPNGADIDPDVLIYDLTPARLDADKPHLN